MNDQREPTSESTFTVVDGAMSYRIFLPDWRTDHIQRVVAQNAAPYEVEMLRDLAARLHPGDHVLDIGANIGNHTLYLAACGMNVDAFEPDGSLTSAIEESVSVNSLEDAVRVHTTALGAISASARLVRGDQSNIGMQKIVSDSLAGKEVQVVPLDEVVVRRPVRAMKIDVEGMESDVIAGASGVISADAPLLYIEAATHREFLAIAKIMTRLNYVCWDVFNATPTYLFIHRDQLTEKEIAAQSLLKSIGDLSGLREDLRKVRIRHQKEVRLLEERLEALSPTIGSAGVTVGFREVASWFKGVTKPLVSHSLGPHGWTFVSRIPAGEFNYFLASKAVNLEPFLNAGKVKVRLASGEGLNIRAVFVFKDALGAQLGISFAPPGESVRLDVPAGATEVRFGFRIKGSGSAEIRGISLWREKTESAL